MLPRPERSSRDARPVARVPITVSRPALPALRRNVSLPVRSVTRTNPTVRILERSLPAPSPTVAIERSDLPDWSGFQIDPYEDYARSLTPEGGILICYKDYDRRLRHTLWRLFAWSVSTGGEAWLLLANSPLHARWISILCLLAMALINWLIVRKPVEIHRRIEIRPDCMIVEGADVFWLRLMENGWPSFHRDEDGDQVLSGIYGTRFVEYLTVPRFDEFDRAAEVFAAHLQDAMRQLWTRPY
jgi:hypothetical protein